MNNFFILLCWIVFKAFLNNIWTELLLWKINKITHKFFTNSLIDFWNLKIQHKLYNIVCVWIHYKNKSIFGYAFNNHHFLLECCRVDALLHDTASVLMTSNLYTVFTNSVVYELVIFRSPNFQDFLYYMISVYFVAHI